MTRARSRIRKIAMQTFSRFILDETAAGGLNYIAATSVITLLTLGTFHEARSIVTDKFDALLAALKKQAQSSR
jgi:hypothetical protein